MRLRVKVTPNLLVLYVMTYLNLETLFLPVWIKESFSVVFYECLCLSNIIQNLPTHYKWVNSVIFQQRSNLVQFEWISRVWCSLVLSWCNRFINRNIQQGTLWWWSVIYCFSCVWCITRQCWWVRCTWCTCHSMIRLHWSLHSVMWFFQFQFVKLVFLF